MLFQLQLKSCLTSSICHVFRRQCSPSHKCLSSCSPINRLSTCFLSTYICPSETDPFPSQLRFGWGRHADRRGGGISTDPSKNRLMMPCEILPAEQRQQFQSKNKQFRQGNERILTEVLDIGVTPFHVQGTQQVIILYFINSYFISYCNSYCNSYCRRFDMLLSPNSSRIKKYQHKPFKK